MLTKPRAAARDTMLWLKGPANMSGKSVKMATRMGGALPQAFDGLHDQATAGNIDLANHVFYGLDERFPLVQSGHVDIIAAGGQHFHDRAQGLAGTRLRLQADNLVVVVPA